jgi:hypothetical protein
MDKDCYKPIVSIDLHMDKDCYTPIKGAYWVITIFVHVQDCTLVIGA